MLPSRIEICSLDMKFQRQIFIRLVNNEGQATLV